MLNGKFYTGLTPRMMERTAGAPNRLESHLYWPDDTQVETPHETRTRRRSSFQTETPRDATTYQRQSSWTSSGGGSNGENEVDTKQRFQKEFAKSSIKFFDNIQEEDYGNRNSQRPPQHRQNKQDITTKPTAIKMQLPNNETAQDEYAALKKKQTFSSKIQFYDFMDDAGERQNNQIKPKMDMNDKKEVERHTKNSPKLQVKGINRNLRIADQRLNNERERLTSERNAKNYDDTQNSRSGARVIRNEVGLGERKMNSVQQQSKNYDGQRPGQSNYHNDHEENDYAIPHAQSVPKKILKNPNNFERDYTDDYNEYNEGFNRDLVQLEHSTHNIRLRDRPKKHVNYGDEDYEYKGNHDNYDDERDLHSNYREYGQGSKSMARTSSRNGAISAHSSRNQTKTTNERRRNSPTQSHDYYDDQQPDEKIEFNNHKSDLQTNSKNSFHFNNNDNSKQNNQQQQQQQQRRNTPKMSLSLNSTKAASAVSNSAASPTSPTLDSQKHLRSSLCFYGGEIVANNASEATPTSESGSRQRTARSAATTRRVCVGLPD